MKWPWVSRARLELLEHNCRAAVALWERTSDAWRDAWADEKRRADELTEKYHSLRVSGANPPEPTPVVALPETDSPPSVVLAAIQLISPTRDKTYEANWLHWERNKEKAATNPEQFAEEILKGV